LIVGRQVRKIVAGEGGVAASPVDAVIAVYVEATAEETETRLLKGLRRQVRDLPAILVWSKRWRHCGRGVP